MERTLCPPTKASGPAHDQTRGSYHLTTSPMTPWIGFFWGAFGGLCVMALELRVIYKSASPTDRDHVNKWFPKLSWWLVGVGLSLIGGILVVAYLQSDFKLNALLAIQVGASAPLLLESLAKNVLPGTPGSSAPAGTNTSAAPSQSQVSSKTDHP